MGLGQNPYRAILEAALLKFRPVNLDVLPLYIVLLAAFPFVLPALLRWPLGRDRRPRSALYAATCHFDWNLPGYPDDKVWFFNPMAWQVVFYCGAVLAVVAPRSSPGSTADAGRSPCWPCSTSLFAAFIALSWHYNSLERLIPDWVARQIYPIDKTNLDILRFLHFLAIAWLVRLVVRPDAAFLKWRIFEPLRRCGEHSLQIFCLGTFLAVTAQIIVAQYEESNRVADCREHRRSSSSCPLAAYGAAWFKRGLPAEVRRDALGAFAGGLVMALALWSSRRVGRDAQCRAAA